MALPKIYTDETAARKHLERLQWPDGPTCPHCGVVDQATLLKGNSTRPGVYKCRACEKPFSVTVGTVFEDSHVPLHKWLYAAHLLTASKKGISSHQLHRTLGVSYKTAWFMSHRIREAMRPAALTPMGGTGKTVEMDETAQGRIEGAPRGAHRRMGQWGRGRARDPHKHGRGLLLNFQTRHEGHLPALQREAPTSLSVRVRFSVQLPRSPWLQRCYARRQGSRGHPRKAADLPTT